MSVFLVSIWGDFMGDLLHCWRYLSLSAVDMKGIQNHLAKKNLSDIHRIVFKQKTSNLFLKVRKIKFWSWFFCRKIDSRQKENSLQKKYFTGTNLVEEKNKLVGREEEIWMEEAGIFIQRKGNLLIAREVKTAREESPGRMNGYWREYKRSLQT